MTPVVQNYEKLPENRQLQQNQAGDQLDADARGNQFYRYLSAIFAHQPGQKEKHQQSGRSLKSHGFCPPVAGWDAAG
jgi:hypothetical protein